MDTPETDDALERPCSTFDDDELTSARCEGASWHQLGLQLRLSFAVWVAFYFFCVAGRVAWTRFVETRMSRRRWVTHWFGGVHRLPVDDRLETTLCILQYVCSSISTVMWIVKSYERVVVPRTFAIDVACSAVFIVHLAFTTVQHGFDPQLAFTWEVVLDAVTVTPLVIRHGFWGIRYRTSWLSLSYVRVLKVIRMFERFMKTAFVQRDVASSAAMTCAKILELVGVIVILSSTMLIVESLGDFSSFQDKFLLAQGGKISFFQMCYFTFTTISTVGYGDFSPKTVIGRLLIVPSILLGVTFFSVSSAELLRIRTAEASGRGRFHPNGGFLRWRRRPARRHVVVIGGGVSCGSATVIEPLLQQLCRTDREQIPEVLLLARNECSDSVRAVLMHKWARNAPVRYFVGSPMNALDLDRVRIHEAEMAFIVANINTDQPEREDRQNILHAVALKRASPRTPIRLILLTMDKLSLAVSSGVDPLHCVTINEFKTNLLFSSLIHPGFLTLALNLGLAGISAPHLRAQLPGGGRAPDWRMSPWLCEYIEGTQYEIIGFLPETILLGKTFGQAAILCGQYDVALLGAQVCGRVELVPRNKRSPIAADTILFAAAKTKGDNLAKVARTWNEADWVDEFRKARGTRTLNGSERRLFGVADNGIALDDPPSGASSPSEPRLTTTTTTATTTTTTTTTTSRPRGEENPDRDDESAPPEEDVESKRKTLAKQRSAFGSKKWLTQNRSKHLEFNHRDCEFGPAARDVSPVVRKIQAQRLNLQASLLRMAGSMRDRLRILEDDADDASSTASDDVVSHKIRAVIEQGDHVIVIIQGNGLWHQVAAVIATLRRTHTTAVVLVGVCRPPSALLDKYERVYFVFGEPERLSTLIAAGAVTCARLLTLLPNAPPVDEADMMDEQNVMVVAVIETQLANWNRTDMTCVYDWYSLKNLQQLPQPRSSAGNSQRSSIYQTTRHAKAWPIRFSRWLARRVVRSATTNLNYYVPPYGDRSPIRHHDEDDSYPPLFFKSAAAAKEKNGRGKQRDAHRVRPQTTVPSLGRAETERADIAIFKGETPRARRPSASNFGPPELMMDADRGTADAADEDNVDGFVKLSLADTLCAALEPRTDSRFCAGRILPKSEIAGMCAAAAYFPGIDEVLRELIGGRRDQTASVYAHQVDSDFVGRPYSDLAAWLLEHSAIPLGVLRRHACGPMPYVVTCGPAYRELLNDGDALFVLADVEWDSLHVTTYPPPPPAARPELPKRYDENSMSSSSSSGGGGGMDASSAPAPSQLEEPPDEELPSGEAPPPPHQDDGEFHPQETKQQPKHEPHKKYLRFADECDG